MPVDDSRISTEMLVDSGGRDRIIHGTTIKTEIRILIQAFLVNLAQTPVYYERELKFFIMELKIQLFLIEKFDYIYSQASMKGFLKKHALSMENVQLLKP